MTTEISLEEIFELSHAALVTAGASDAAAKAVARTITNAERDGSTSHGLFRLPGYVASLKSGKLDGKIEPEIIQVTPVVISCDAGNGLAPYALECSLPVLIDAAVEFGIAVLGLKRSAHFAALWPEVEQIAEAGLVGLACTTYMPAVAPAGGRTALFGTNPVAFAWPRENQPPVVFDMATSARALGEIQIAARDGHTLPEGVGLDADGEPTTDPAKILEGVILPFGGYKGSAISMMVELLAGAMVGQTSSFRTAERDNNDGGPPPRGELIVAFSPEVISGGDWEEESELLFHKLESMEGVRLPGSRRHINRRNCDQVNVNEELLEKARLLVG